MKDLVKKKFDNLKNLFYLCETKTLTMKTTKDTQGKEILVGNEVMYIRSGENVRLEFGIVKRITDKIVFIEGKTGGRQITKDNCERMLYVVK